MTFYAFTISTRYVDVRDDVDYCQVDSVPVPFMGVMAVDLWSLLLKQHPDAPDFVFTPERLDAIIKKGFTQFPSPLKVTGVDSVNAVLKAVFRMGLFETISCHSVDKAKSKRTKDGGAANANCRVIFRVDKQTRKAITKDDKAAGAALVAIAGSSYLPLDKVNVQTWLALGGWVV